MSIDSKDLMFSFLTGGCAIHCSTEKQASRLMSFLKRYNIGWAGGEDMNNSGWNTFKKDTYYYLYPSIVKGGRLVNGVEEMFLKYNRNNPDGKQIEMIDYYDLGAFIENYGSEN